MALSLTGFLERAEDLFKPKADHSAVTSERDTLKAENEQLRKELAAEKDKASGFEVSIKQKDADLTTAKASILSITKERDDFKATIEKPDGAIQLAATAKAAEIARAQGIPPIASTPAENPAAPKQEPKLFGLARVQAAFGAQIKHLK